MNEPLLHYSEAPFHLGPFTHRQVTSHKPLGLWFSVGASWADWCETEDFRLHALAVVSEVVLTDDANILRISTEDELDVFSIEYGEDTFPDIHERYFPGEPCADRVRWEAVADAYQGIIIAPYLWSRRLHRQTSWYYGWDCASGCIWDASAVAELRLVGPVAAS